MKDSVSIIIASYNSAEYLPGTIASCLKQTHPPAEIRIIDDGSSDDTEAVCQQFAGEIIYQRVENGGVSRARNLGAREAGGHWLLFLDSDDRLLPHTVDTLVHTARETEAGVAYGMVLDRREPPREPRLAGFHFIAGNPPLPAERNLRRCGIVTPGSALVARDLHQEIGGFVTGYEPMEDRDYWIKCGCLSRVAFADTVVLDKTWRPGSAGSQHDKRIYRGLLAQRALRSWGREHHLGLPWLPEDSVLLEWAIQEALWLKRDAILQPLLQLSQAMQASGYWLWRARMRLFLLNLLGRRPTVPSWLATS